jgi:hypothetical protein
MFSTARSDRIRSHVTLDEIDGLQITIPAARSAFLVLFLGVWLVGWSIGELAALGTLAAWAFGGAPGLKFGSAGAAPVPFLIFWTVAGGLVMDALVWQFRGRETIGIDPDGQTLVIRRLGTFVPRRTRTFSMDDVRNLRVSPLGLTMFPSPFAFRENWEA